MLGSHLGTRLVRFSWCQWSWIIQFYGIMGITILARNGMGRYVNIWNFNRLIQYYGFKHILIGVFGTMEFYDFPIILGIIIPTDELIFFRGVETTNQLIYFNIYWWDPSAWWPLVIVSWCFFPFCTSTVFSITSIHATKHVKPQNLKVALSQECNQSKPLRKVPNRKIHASRSPNYPQDFTNKKVQLVSKYH